MAIIRPVISTDKFGDLTFLVNDKKNKDLSRGKVRSYNGQVTGVEWNLPQGAFTFVPQNLVEKGWISDGKQNYFEFLLNKDNFDSLTNDGVYIDLAGLADFDAFAEKSNISTKGFLIPRGTTVANQIQRPVTGTIRSYNTDGYGKGDYKIGEIQGLSFINGNPTYITQAFGPNATQGRIQAPDTLDYTGQNTTDKGRIFVDWYKEGRSPLGSFGDFINDVVGSDLFKIAALGLGAYGLASAAGAAGAGAGAAGAGAGAAGAGAAGASLAPGSFQAALPGLGVQTAATTAGATAIPGTFAAALPGLVAPVGILDLPSYGLLDTAQFPTEGIKATASTTGGAAAPFATTPAYSELTTAIPAAGGAATVPGLSVPGLSSMGGGTGLQVPVAGGTVTEMGFVPAGATPSLGDPSSFINNPDYLGSPVISEDYLALTAKDMPSGLSVKDALDAARLGSQLLSPQQQMQQGGLLAGGVGGQTQPMGVDFSSLMGRTMVGLLPLAEQYRRSLL